MVNEDKKTWERIQQQDEKAFGQYYKDNHGRFFLMACQYLHDHTLAQEVVNDVFLTIWEKAGGIRIETSLTAYIYKAIINRSINVLNKQKKDLLKRKDYHPAESTPVIRQMEDNELKLLLFRAIDQLPEQCRNVFRMSRYEQLKQQEIAGKLGISIKTVKNHITHALKQLHRALGNQPLLWLLILKIIFFRGH